MKKRILNVAFLGAGKIAHKLAETFLGLPEMFNLYSVASRDIEKAIDFKEKYHFENAYDSYEEMLKDDNIDLVYISTVISLHKDHIMLCLKHNRPVLVEKSFTNNANEALEVINYAKGHQIFLAEAIWTRYMSSRNIINSLLLSNAIGEIYYIEANLGYEIRDIERLYSKELGGGAMKDVGVYPLNFIDMFTNSKVKSIKVDKKLLETGVDETCSVNLIYENGVIAHFFTTLNNATSRDGFIYGKEGFIKVININNPERIEIYRHDDKSHNYSDLISTLNIKYDINGYEYQLIETYNSLIEGKKENPSMKLDESLKIMELIDKILK